MRRRLQTDEWYREFGHRLRATRIALGLTEEEAAAVAGRTVETWKRYESTGMGNATRPILLFAKCFHVSLDWLICGEGVRLGAHFYKYAAGKIAILPTSGRQAS